MSQIFVVFSHEKMSTANHEQELLMQMSWKPHFLPTETKSKIFTEDLTDIICNKLQIILHFQRIFYLIRNKNCTWQKYFFLKSLQNVVFLELTNIIPTKFGFNCHWPSSVRGDDTCSYSLMLHIYQRNIKYQYYSLCLDLIGTWTHDLLHSRRARQPLHHWCSS